MDFRLTYEGVLLGASKRNTRPGHKHEIRKVFHQQLKRLWEVEPYLRTMVLTRRDANPPGQPRPRMVDHLSSEYGGLRLYCSLDVLFLRPSMPGEVMQSGDLDNRLKTLFDALRMPSTKEELGGYDKPADGESPFYCLMTDDKLITKVTVETDRLLQPTGGDRGDNDSRLVIAVRLKPHDMGWDTSSFA